MSAKYKMLQFYVKQTWPEFSPSIRWNRSLADQAVLVGWTEEVRSSLASLSSVSRETSSPQTTALEHFEVHKDDYRVY